ncbi:hypothetical protein L210DRAFT_484476 [Boletus edulis BED1]|uniref:C2H2-type domain-containing protein n=1 Tax=Boletus edulis BED1 TaxID=1328754 RepID=A0AAD4BGL9_BOLED|nr:hypothetical protein L210DRAFT_484476 [Boletus edulis BED1]
MYAAPDLRRDATLIQLVDLPQNSFPNSSSELDDIPEFSHLATTNHPYITGPGLSLPYSAIVQENGTATFTDRGLSPSSLGSPVPSPTSSFASSLSPLSFYDTPLSDNESPVSPSPATSDQQFHWPPQVLHSQSNESLALHPSLIESFSTDSILPSGSLGPPSHRRSKSSPTSRREPVASKAMLEANSRRRRHPAQFECEDCKQTFTAQFSLRRHQQSHSGERPFACGIPGCTQRFYNSSDCKRHEKSMKRHKDLMMQ